MNSNLKVSLKPTKTTRRNLPPSGHFLIHLLLHAVRAPRAACEVGEGYGHTALGDGLLGESRDRHPGRAVIHVDGAGLAETDALNELVVHQTVHAAVTAADAVCQVVHPDGVAVLLKILDLVVPFGVQSVLFPILF